MKVKYIKVNTADRLPEKSGIYPVIFNLGGETIVETVNYEHELGFYAENTDCHLIDEWLEEVPDREEEMREMLEELVTHHFDFMGCGEIKELQKKAEQLLNELKPN